MIYRIIKLKEFSRIVFINILIAVTLGAFLDVIYTKLFATDTVAIEQKYRFKSDYYHHDLKANFNGQGWWGGKTYRICTDNNGFKSKCNSKQAKSFDFAFIGDSVTEGVGLRYEKTFVGLFHEASDLNVANMAVVSIHRLYI